MQSSSRFAGALFDYRFKATPHKARASRFARILLAYFPSYCTSSPWRASARRRRACTIWRKTWRRNLRTSFVRYCLKFFSHRCKRSKTSFASARRKNLIPLALRYASAAACGIFPVWAGTFRQLSASLTSRLLYCFGMSWFLTGFWSARIMTGCPTNFHVPNSSAVIDPTIVRTANTRTNY